MVEGVVIDFLTAAEIGQSGGSLHGVEAISDPGTTLWVKQGGLYYEIAPSDLMWLTDLTEGGVHKPIQIFGVCIGGGL